MIDLRKLSPKELEVFQLIVDNGLSSKEIAYLRGCAYSTIESHRNSMMKKLKFDSTVKLTIAWYQQLLTAAVTSAASAASAAAIKDDYPK